MSRTAMVDIDSYKLKKYIALSEMSPAEISQEIGASTDYVTRALRDERISVSHLDGICDLIGISKENVLRQHADVMDEQSVLSSMGSIETLCDFIIEGIEKFKAHCQEEKEA